MYAAAFEKDAGLTLVLAKNGVLKAHRRCYPIRKPALIYDRCRRHVSFSLREVQFEHRKAHPWCSRRPQWLPWFYQWRIGTLCHCNKNCRVSTLFTNSRMMPLCHSPRLVSNLWSLFIQFSTSARSQSRLKQATRNVFSVLSAAAIIASKSKFLGSICANDNQFKHMKENLAEKLKHHLSKLSQYDHSINILITHAHRFRETGFRVHWIHPRPDIEEPVLSYTCWLCHGHTEQSQPKLAFNSCANSGHSHRWEVPDSDGGMESCGSSVSPCRNLYHSLFPAESLVVGQYSHRATANRMPEETKLLQLRFGGSLNSRNHENPFRNIKIRTSGLKLMSSLNLLYDSLLTIYVLVRILGFKDLEFLKFWKPFIKTLEPSWWMALESTTQSESVSPKPMIFCIPTSGWSTTSTKEKNAKRNFPAPQDVVWVPCQWRNQCS